jgi:hypothetical protein
MNTLLFSVRNCLSLILLVMALLVLCSAVHLSIWKFKFPTPLERLLRRVAEVGIAATLLVLYFIGIGISVPRLQVLSGIGEHTYRISAIFAVVFYTCAKIFIEQVVASALLLTEDILKSGTQSRYFIPSTLKRKEGLLKPEVVAVEA